MKKSLFIISIIIIISCHITASADEVGIGWQTTFLYADLPWDSFYSKYKDDTYLLTGPVLSIKTDNNLWFSCSFLLDTFTKKSDFATVQTGSSGEFTSSWKADINSLYMDIIFGYLYNNLNLYCGGRAFGFLNTVNIDFHVSAPYSNNDSFIEYCDSGDFLLFAGLTYYKPVKKKLFLNISAAGLYGMYIGSYPVFEDNAGKVSAVDVEYIHKTTGFSISSGATVLLFNDKLSISLSPKFELQNFYAGKINTDSIRDIKTPDLPIQKIYSLSLILSLFF